MADHLQFFKINVKIFTISKGFIGGQQLNLPYKTSKSF